MTSLAACWMKLLYCVLYESGSMLFMLKTLTVLHPPDNQELEDTNKGGFYCSGAISWNKCGHTYFDNLSFENSEIISRFLSRDSFLCAEVWKTKQILKNYFVIILMAIFNANLEKQGIYLYKCRISSLSRFFTFHTKLSSLYNFSEDYFRHSELNTILFSGV